MPKYSGNMYELRITRVKQDDGGEYEVTAENAYGRVRATVSLTVECECLDSLASD